MSEAKVKIERNVPGGKTETKTVARHFYDMLNPNPDYNGGWRIAAPEEVADKAPEQTGQASATTTGTQPGAEDPKAKDEELGKVPAKVAASEPVAPAPDLATAPAKVAAAEKKTRAPRTTKPKPAAPAVEDLNKMD